MKRFISLILCNLLLLTFSSCARFDDHTNADKGVSSSHETSAGTTSNSHTSLDGIRNSYEANRDNWDKNDNNQFTRFDILKSQNPDIVGWITIPNTQINMPFYQTIDNFYYSIHDMDKKDNSYGALFLDYRCSITPTNLSQNQIIYGNDARYGNMFGDLKKYCNVEFYKNNPIFYIDTLYERRVYKIFAVVYGNDDLYRTNFTSGEDFLNWAGSFENGIIYNPTVTVLPNDETIVLSSINSESKNIAIIGRLVRKGEDAVVNTSSITQ